MRRNAAWHSINHWCIDSTQFPVESSALRTTFFHFFLSTSTHYYIFEPVNSRLERLKHSVTVQKSYENTLTQKWNKKSTYTFSISFEWIFGVISVKLFSVALFTRICILPALVDVGSSRLRSVGSMTVRRTAQSGSSRPASCAAAISLTTFRSTCQLQRPQLRAWSRTQQLHGGCTFDRNMLLHQPRVWYCVLRSAHCTRRPNCPLPQL